MNYQIQELADQALQHVADMCTGGDISRLNTDANSVKKMIQDKFAELIIKECAAEAHRRVCVDGDDNMIYDNLLNHFGVK